MGLFICLQKEKLEEMGVFAKTVGDYGSVVVLRLKKHNNMDGKGDIFSWQKVNGDVPLTFGATYPNKYEAINDLLRKSFFANMPLHIETVRNDQEFIDFMRAPFITE
jgi:hypothetical protein